MSDIERARRLLDESDLLMMDFDGVMADMEPLHARSYAFVLRGLGVQFVETDFLRYVGRPEEEIWSMLSEDFHIKLSRHENAENRIHELWRLVVAEEMRPSWFVKPLLSYAAGMPRLTTTVVSSQRTDIIQGLLSLWSLDQYHLGIATADDRGRSKEELIQLLPQEAEVALQRCLLIEDSRHFLALARQLGIKTIGVRHSLNDIQPAECDLLLDIHSSG
jgi:beta-phosphoglucomutase-like phosphatase (HAD superfamily)